MSRQKQETLFWGVILLLAGILFTLDNIGLDINIGRVFAKFWPMILIGIGLKNIFYHLKIKQGREK